ncbi:hypothetical protein [Mycolicibacterium iranicum]|uniref:Uncharacterized protein n=1 Tax=Mycolicibacterium iranicum TaxID=912594 RepID=A0A178LZM8_MYCIR|nr:hypothetical protein [Mycolicibacterium iranicum]OAN40405.1 hypothetical protein A4X20_14325 [Mycolicibacterium iranicum]
MSGQVAMIEDDYTLVINRGAESGVVPGMVFAVYSESGPVITDPESGRELGRLTREKLRVRVFDVQPLFARAHTFVNTGDFYGLLQLPFTAPQHEDIVTVDVGDTVDLVTAERAAHRASRPKG